MPEGGATAPAWRGAGKYFACVADCAPESACYVVMIASRSQGDGTNMKRSSRSITLVLLSSAAFLAGCEDRPAALPVQNANTAPVPTAIAPELVEAEAAASQPATMQAAPRAVG